MGATQIDETAADAVGGTDPGSLPPVRDLLEGAALLLLQGSAVGREATTLVAE